MWMRIKLYSHFKFLSQINECPCYVLIIHSSQYYCFVHQRLCRTRLQNCVYNTYISSITMQITLQLLLPQYHQYPYSFPSWLTKVKSKCINYPTAVVCRYNLDSYFLPKWTQFILLLCT